MTGPARIRLATAVAPRAVDVGRGVRLLFAAATPAAHRAIGFDVALARAGGAGDAASDLDVVLAHLLTGWEGIEAEDAETGEPLEFSWALWREVARAHPWLLAAGRRAASEIMASAREVAAEGNASPPSSPGAQAGAADSARTAPRRLHGASPPAPDTAAAAGHAQRTRTP